MITKSKTAFLTLKANMGWDVESRLSPGDGVLREASEFCVHFVESGDTITRRESGHTFSQGFYIASNVVAMVGWRCVRW